MTPTLDTSPLSDAEILHLLRTLAPGVPPGLDQPPLPPASLTAPPWVAGRPARAPLRWLTLAAGSLGLLLLWGLTHSGGRHLAPPAPTAFATPAPGAVYWARAEATATAVSALPPVLPAWTPTPLALVPTIAPTALPPPLPPPTVPPVLPTTVPPPLPPPTATPVGASAPPPAPRAVEPAAPPAPVPPATRPATPTAVPPTPLPVTPPSAGGSGAWGNDWSGSIFDRSATIGAPPPPAGTSP
jgi:hypothetical protein